MSFRFVAVYINKSVPFVVKADSAADALTKAKSAAPKALAVVPVRF